MARFENSCLGAAGLAGDVLHLGALQRLGLEVAKGADADATVVQVLDGLLAGGAVGEPVDVDSPRVLAHCVSCRTCASAR
jgi:hypothetical protein